MMTIRRSLTLILISLFLLVPQLISAQSTDNRLCNPVLSMRDGAVERFNGMYYAIGEATKGNIYFSKDLVHWSGPVFAVAANEALWLKDPKWTQAYTYKEVGAGEIVYRNGVFHTYWNGVGHAYAATPLGPYKEQSINEPFDDYGIDVQVFQDEDGEVYWVKKRNASDPHPMTGAPSNIDGPEVWTLKMISPFSRKDITVGKVQLTHQPGHPTSVNMHNFEGPELLKYRGEYYLLFVSNRMGPRSGMYEIGAAQSDGPMNFDNSKKYPHPVLTRNTEQHLLDYKVLLPSAEHGGWQARYTTNDPKEGWIKSDFNDNDWLDSLGGFGRQEYDYFANVRFTHAKIRARKTFWTTPKIYIRRKFTLKEVPEKVALKYWLFADASFFINGKKITINERSNTYSTMQLDPSFFVKGENIIAVEALSPCSDNKCSQFIDFGLYDTGKNDVEDIVVGPGQPNFVTGPNGFERWLMYKAYFNNKQIQGIDRVHFYGKEMVVESSTVKNTKGYRPKPAMPVFIDYFDTPAYNVYEFLNGSKWKITEGVLLPEKPGAALLLKQATETNYRFEVPFRLIEKGAQAGVYAFYQDEKNWLKIQINSNGNWISEWCVKGKKGVETKKLPEKFAFLENHPLVSHYDAPWHTLTVYKNDNRFRLELDQFNLTISGDIFTQFSGSGRVGLIAASDRVAFDAIQYTMGWDEYDDNIAGWKSASGNWSVTKKGLMQSQVNGESAGFKGDKVMKYEFSAYLKNEKLPSSGKAGFYPLYVDKDNYVRASVNYQTRKFEIEQKKEGKQVSQQSFSLQKKVLRYYTVKEYPTSSYQYDFRNESVISGIDILWMEGNYPYLKQTFALPKSVQFYALQEGKWVMLNAKPEGMLSFSVPNRYTFPEVKTTAIKMVVTNQNGFDSRAFSAWFTEEISAGSFLRCRKENDELHLFIDDNYLGEVKGNWGKSSVGLFTDNQSATFNGMLFYELGENKN